MKRYLLIGCGAVVFGIILWVAYVLFFDKDNVEFDFEKDRGDMEKVAFEIMQGQYEIKENGVVGLPEKYERLSDTGEVCLVMFNGKSAIYFWTDRGVLESSRGYVYVLDDVPESIMDKFSMGNNFVYMKEVAESWYSVSTD